MSHPDPREESYLTTIKYNDYWKPRYRYEFVEWFKKNRPTWKISDWHLSKLRAIYHKERKKSI